MSDHLIFMGGGGVGKSFEKKKKIPGPNFARKICRTGLFLLYVLYFIQIIRQDRVPSEKNIQVVAPYEERGSP